MTRQVHLPELGLLLTLSQRGVRRLEWSSTQQSEDQTSPPSASGSSDDPPWVGELVRRLTDYFSGAATSFEGVPLDLEDQPPFRRTVLETCRKVPFGETVTYAELARRAGRPAAVRAVGSAMSHNPVPIVVPCHRVVRSDGGLGGFSAPGGIQVKERLLAMENNRC